MTILFRNTQSEAIPYLWSYVYCTGGLEQDGLDYVYSSIPKPLGECVVPGTFHRPGDLKGVAVVAALYYNNRVLSGRLFRK